jgi:hypothetical protein
MVAIKNILLFVAAASALTLGKRDAKKLLDDISKIDTDVVSAFPLRSLFRGQKTEIHSGPIAAQ